MEEFASFTPSLSASKAAVGLRGSQRCSKFTAPSRTFKTKKSLTTYGLTHYYTSKTIRDPLKFPSTFVIGNGELAGHRSPTVPSNPRRYPDTCNTNTLRACTQSNELQSPSPAFSCAGPRKREHRTKKLVQASAEIVCRKATGNILLHPALPVIVPCTCVPFFSSMVTVSWLSFIRNLGIKNALKKPQTRSLPHKAVRVRRAAPSSSAS